MYLTKTFVYWVSWPFTTYLLKCIASFRFLVVALSGCNVLRHFLTCEWLLTVPLPLTHQSFSCAYWKSPSWQAKNNLVGHTSKEARDLELSCSLNLMSCYLKTKQFSEAVALGTEVCPLGLLWTWNSAIRFLLCRSGCVIFSAVWCEVQKGADYMPLPSELLSIYFLKLG